MVNSLDPDLKKPADPDLHFFKRGYFQVQQDKSKLRLGAMLNNPFISNVLYLFYQINSQ